MSIAKYKNVNGKWEFWHKRKINKAQFKNAKGLILSSVFPNDSREYRFEDKKGFLNVIKILKT